MSGVVAEMKLLYDDQRCPVQMKMKILEMVVDSIKESAKIRQPEDPASGMSDEDLRKTIEALNRVG